MFSPFLRISSTRNLHKQLHWCQRERIYIIDKTVPFKIDYRHVIHFGFYISFGFRVIRVQVYSRW